MCYEIYGFKGVPRTRSGDNGDSPIPSIVYYYKHHHLSIFTLQPLPRPPDTNKEEEASAFLLSRHPPNAGSWLEGAKRGALLFLLGLH